MSQPKSPALDPAEVPEVTTSNYPEPFRNLVMGRHRRRLGDAGGLTHFGVNLTRLDPGCVSSMRHWHSEQDELIYVLEGEVTLVTDAGPRNMRPGMFACFPAGRADGHHLKNETDRPVVFLEVGDRTKNEHAHYSDVDLEGKMIDSRWTWTRKDGTLY